MNRPVWRAIVQDVQVSVKLTKDNFASFALGMLGVMLLTALLMALALGVTVVIFMLLSQSMTAWVSALVEWSSVFAQSPTPVLAWGAFFVLLVVTVPVFLAIGALFGMSREVVEGAGTAAAGVLTWYRRRSKSLAAGGAALYCTVVGPAYLIVTLPYLSPVGDTSVVAGVTVGVATFWVMLVGGLTSLTFPAVIDGLPVHRALPLAVSTAVRYFDRVMGVWVAFLVLFGLTVVAPLYAFIVLGALPNLLGVILVIAGAIVAVFVLVPAMAVALSRLYMILTAADLQDATDEGAPGPLFVGGP